MSQPITLTLARKAPRPLRWLGVACCCWGC
ncbi:urea ABC transporter permease [Klebsiella michiganensis]|nr:urea ABC transporter permease [Klebsiella michiganensis]